MGRLSLLLLVLLAGCSEACARNEYTPPPVADATPIEDNIGFIPAERPDDCYNTENTVPEAQ